MFKAKAEYMGLDDLSGGSGLGKTDLPPPADTDCTQFFISEGSFVNFTLFPFISRLVWSSFESQYC